MTWWSSTSITLVRLSSSHLLPSSEILARNDAGHVGPATSLIRFHLKVPPIRSASARMFLNPWPLAS